MKQLLFTAVLCLFSLAAFCQNSSVDSFVTKTGVVHKGQLVENYYPDYFIFRTADDYRLRVPYSTVSTFFFNNSAYAPTSFTRQTPYYEQRYIARRATGMGLTFAGLGMLITGTALIAAHPDNIHTYRNSLGGGVNFTGAAAGGFVLDLISPALFISGAVIWAKANRAIQFNKASKAPHDL